MAEGTKRPAQIVLGAETRKLRRDLAAAKGEIRGFGKDAASSIRSTVGTAFAGVFSLASLGGAVSVVKGVVANERALTRLGIQADVSDDRVRALAGTMMSVSNATGQTTKDLIAGASQIVTLTGDFELAASSAQGLGMAATATGAQMEDLAGVAASLSQNMGIAGNQIGYALDILAIGGKKGSVELKDLAMLLPTASAGFKVFGEEGQRGVAVLGAALQVSKTATGTASEAATAFNALGKSLIANAGRIKKLSGGKVKVFEIDPKTKRKVARDFVDIVKDLRASKLGRDPEALIKALGTEEAAKSFIAISDNWDAFQSLIASGLAGGGTLEADFKRYLESPAGRMERAWTQASNALQAAVTPERVEKIAAATEVFAQALGFVVDHALHLVALLGAAKLGQFALATNKWAMAMSGVATSTAQVSGAVTRGAAGMSTMVSGTGRLVGGLGRALANAGGIASAFTASFAATSMLIDALGVFEDKTRTMATADDPNEKASGQAVMLAQADKDITNLEEARRRRRREIAARGANPDEVDDSQIADIDARLIAARQERSQRRAAFTAATIGERDAARGTNALDDIVGNLRTLQAQQAGLGRLGSIAEAAPAVDMEVLRQYAPEAQNLTGAELARVVALLEKQLEETERMRALQERVNQPRVTVAATVGAGVSAPRTGTSPR